MKSKASLKKHLDDLLENLDAATPSKDIILGKDEDKEHFETCLMFAFRKLQAARHHLDNVHRFKKAALGELDDLTPPDLSELVADTKGKKVTSVMSVRSIAYEYTYELSACFAAIKGSLDFLTIVCVKHFPGIKGNSISILMRLVEKKHKTGPFLDEVAKKLNWLKELRDYRDHLVHRLCISPSSGWIIESNSEQISKQNIPVIVPQSTPKFVADTRRARLSDGGQMTGLSETRSEASVRYSDGTKEIVENSTTYAAAPGFLLIEELMRYHITELEEFFESIVVRLTIVDFKSVSLSTSKDSSDPSH